MSRVARIIIKGLPHHVTQRGNYQQVIFSNRQDRSRYLALIQKYAREFKTEILAYCLMLNHVHFVAIPHEKECFSKTFSVAHMRYSHYYNAKQKTKGHLWQGRFYSCVLDEHHTLAAIRYIERNPVRARLVDKPWEWEWSSAATHTYGKKSAIILYDISKIIGLEHKDWQGFLDNCEPPGSIKEIKACTRGGRPFGSERFIAELEKKLQMRLSPSRRGRPRDKK